MIIYNLINKTIQRRCEAFSWVLRYSPTLSGSFCEIIRLCSLIEAINSVILCNYRDLYPFIQLASDHVIVPLV